MASSHRSAWLDALLARKPPKLVAISLANKTAWIASKLLTSGEADDGARAPTACADRENRAPPSLAAA